VERAEKDPEYMAELERAMRGVSFGCVLFILGLLLAAVAVLVLAHFFFEFPFLPLK
jgi:hypothetical protein